LKGKLGDERNRSVVRGIEGLLRHQLSAALSGEAQELSDQLHDAFSKASESAKVAGRQALAKSLEATVEFFQGLTANLPSAQDRYKLFLSDLESAYAPTDAATNELRTKSLQVWIFLIPFES
jgi:hypothetical protein